MCLLHIFCALLHWIVFESIQLLDIKLLIIYLFFFSMFKNFKDVTSWGNSVKFGGHSLPVLKLALNLKLGLADQIGSGTIKIKANVADNFLNMFEIPLHY